MAWNPPNDPVLKVSLCKTLVFNVQTENWPGKVAYQQGNLIWWDLSYVIEFSPEVFNEGVSKSIVSMKDLAVKLDMQDHLHLRGMTAR